MISNQWEMEIFRFFRQFQKVAKKNLNVEILVGNLANYIKLAFWWK